MCFLITVAGIGVASVVVALIVIMAIGFGVFMERFEIVKKVD